MKTTIFALLTAFTALSAKPQAIVFDFGGVLTKEPRTGVVEQLLQGTFSFSSDEYRQVTHEKELALQKGRTEEAFWFDYAVRRGIELPDDWFDDFRAARIEEINVNPEMYAIIPQLEKVGLTVALLSNVDANYAHLFKTEGLYDPFNECYLSYEIGFAKPDPRVYEYLVREMKLPAREIVVIDDSPANIHAAKGVGLDAILFTSQEELMKELKARDCSF